MYFLLKKDIFNHFIKKNLPDAEGCPDRMSDSSRCLLELQNSPVLCRAALHNGGNIQMSLPSNSKGNILMLPEM